MPVLTAQNEYFQSNTILDKTISKTTLAERNPLPPCKKHSLKKELEYIIKFTFVLTLKIQFCFVSLLSFVLLFSCTIVHSLNHLRSYNPGQNSSVTSATAGKNDAFSLPPSSPSAVLTLWLHILFSTQLSTLLREGGTETMGSFNNISKHLKQGKYNFNKYVAFSHLVLLSAFIICIYCSCM